MKESIVHTTTRRGFIRNILFTMSILLVTMRIGANKRRNEGAVVSCGTTAKPTPATTVSTVRGGRWSDANTWGGTLPTAADVPLISVGHTIVFDMEEATVAGLIISENSILRFDPAKSATLQSSRNILVQGRLEMQPDTQQVIQTMRFIDVNENNFIGGGMDILENDIGLWVMGEGALDLRGTEKTSWTNAKTGIEQGSTRVVVDSTKNWLPGDEIVITPTESPAVGAAFTSGFEELIIGRVAGTEFTADEAVKRAHPKVYNQWTAEVLNLTRNVRIEGTAKGKAHIFIRSVGKHTVEYVSIRHMGPRKDNNGDGITELVAGRYGLHFHHCGNGSRGSVVKGNVIRDTYNHCYVPHGSHEITFTDNISYNTLETSFWWDPGDSTHDVIYDHNIVAKCNFVQGSLNMNAENAPTFSSSGFGMNTGDGNVCINNVVVAGGEGDFADGGAYNWEAVVNEGVWIFNGNLAHNNGCGLRVWQNSTRNHIVDNYFAYHNKMGLFHGAYANSYTYNGGILYGNGIQVKAASVNSNRVRFENIVINGAGLIDHGVEVIHSPLPGERPVLLRNLSIKGCRVASIIDAVQPEVHSVDVVQCVLEGEIILHPSAAENEVIRVQPVTGAPYSITKNGKATIANFAPTIWGDGKGLKAEYFNDKNFAQHAFTRIDSNVSFSEWSAGVHYAITGSNYAVRWTGRVQPQYSEECIFIVSAGGGCRLWVDDQLVLNNWKENVPTLFETRSIPMKAGEMYNIKLEYFNSEKDTIIGLGWKSASLPLEYIPQSQLYADPLPPEPPVDPGGPQNSLNRVATIARDYIEVRAQEDSGYLLYDEIGRLLRRGNIVRGMNQIYISGISSGILLLKLLNVKKAFRIVKI